jgi:argininosuccinate lyase
MEKLWGGRFTKKTDQKVETFTASIAFDQTLALDDIRGSIAHAATLEQCGILTKEESAMIQQGLQEIGAKIREGSCCFQIEDEDIHMNIERQLYQIIGPLAGKLHTARSRNDQVATDMHLYVRAKIIVICQHLLILQKILIGKAEQHFDLIMPGYTHLQRAQPILFAHHLLAYVWMLGRDFNRFQESFARANLSPLGTGALSGTKIPIDRMIACNLLQFDGLYANSIDAVSDRDFVIEFLSASALLMVHLSRLSEELILWSSQEFGFITLDDAYCTGSSMMPQKKNPDIPELIRGKTGRVIGSLVNILTVLKGLPLTYNRDLQEDKEPLFDTARTLEGVLTILPSLLATMHPNEQAMRAAAQKGFLQATDLAEDLCLQGIPFRQAHQQVGRYVQTAAEIPYDLEASINNKLSIGGTAKIRVQEQIAEVKKNLKRDEEWLEDVKRKIKSM